MNEAEYLMKNYGDRGGCYPPRPTASTDNTINTRGGSRISLRRCCTIRNGVTDW